MAHDCATNRTGDFMLRSASWRVLLALALFTAAATTHAQGNAVTTPRLYVFDGGVLASETARYRLTDADVEEVPLSVASFLVVHPRGVLMWDAGAVADHERAGDVGFEQRLLRRDGQERFVKLAPTLTSQLAAAGYKPSDVTHLALSHYHWDHTADANLFAGAQWLAVKKDYDAMFSANPPGGTRPETYSALKNSSRTTLITAAEHDVFGDGTVVIRQATGHTEGHAVLYVKLKNTGGVVLSGDLYHYPAERTLNRLPTFEVSEAETQASRAEIERFLERTGAALWIQHDLPAHRKLKKSPQYYD
jgi:glyoxylase-like metal-dependent hydrolase (beta-lactamase superfamily II)